MPTAKKENPLVAAAAGATGGADGLTAGGVEATAEVAAEAQQLAQAAELETGAEPPAGL